MPFPLWQAIPPTTAVRDLYRTSILVSTNDRESGTLLRCNPGLDSGSATLVHATLDQPNALRMTGVDDDATLESQAQALVGDDMVHAVSIPHITWKHLGTGLPRRTPIAATITVLTAVVALIPPLSLSAWVAIPGAALLGLLVWLLLRERFRTSIGQPGDSPMTINAVARRAHVSGSSLSRTAAAKADQREASGVLRTPVS